MRRLLAALLVAAPASALAQALEPGEWEFTSTTRSPMLPKPQSVNMKQCVKEEDAGNPERWMGRQDGKSDCTFTHGKKGPDTLTWEMSCPKSNMRGSGSARIGAGTLDSDMQLSGEMRGQNSKCAPK
ncbi:MAG TPA: DUF3617 family protein [Burkholderiales bacterium]|nr:DUF3617 family protein [Burkholderiales bacterium]